MITYVKVCFSIPESAGARGEYPTLITKEFVVKDYEHLITGDALRVKPEVVSCDGIEINKLVAVDPTRLDLMLQTGKTKRMFHFNNVIWFEASENEA